MKSQAKRRWVVLGASIVGVGVLLTGVHAQSVLFVQSNRVGIGTNTPTASLNVYGTDSGSENRLLVQNSSGDTANRNMLELVNDNGGVQFFLTSESDGHGWPGIHRAVQRPRENGPWVEYDFRLEPER